MIAGWLKPVLCWFSVLAGLLAAGCLWGQQGEAAAVPPTPEAHTLNALLDGNGFVQVRPGVFSMGSDKGNPDEAPPHRVRISRGFEMGKFEVTQAQWMAVMRDPHARPKPGEEAPSVNPSEFKDPSRPVENVSWDAIQEFLQKINDRDPSHLYRLPTEAEWEYAAKAGARQDPPNLDRIAWYESNAEGKTRRVGEKQPNAWGLHDMLGNVFEWVQDWYDRAYYPNSPATDPKGGAPGSYKVYRGCAWLSAAKDCRTAYRAFDFPVSGYYSVGFRLVRTRR